MANDDYKGILGYGINAIDNTPQVRDNPEYAEMIAAIQSGNSQEGIRLANRILQQYGVSKGQAIQMGINFFGFGKGR